MPNSVGYLNWTPIFDWDVIKCSSKNKCKKNMYLEEVGVRAQNMVTILRCLLRK